MPELLFATKNPLRFTYHVGAETNVWNLELHRTFTEDKVLMFLQIQTTPPTFQLPDPTRSWSDEGLE